MDHLEQLGVLQRDREHRRRRGQHAVLLFVERRFGAHAHDAERIAANDHRKCDVGSVIGARSRKHRFPERNLGGALAVGERDIAGHRQPSPMRAGPDHRPRRAVAGELGNVTDGRRADRLVGQRLGERLSELDEPFHFGGARRRLAQFRRCGQRFFASLVALPDKVEDEHADQDDEPGQQLKAPAPLHPLRVHQRAGDRPRGDREQRGRQAEQEEQVVATD